MPEAALSPDVLREAARWFVLLASGEASDADRLRWQAWRAADASHESAWLRAEAVAAPFASVPREQAGASAQALRQGKGGRPARRVVLGGLAGLFAAGLLGWQGWRRSDASADALTAIGEQRDLTLADGSLLRLDTDTAVDIVFTDRERLVRLRRGRVLVTTARHAAPAGLPPFLVQTAEGRVQALGTRFSVRQAAGSTHVAVLEARVAIRAQAAAVHGEPPILAAGQAASFDRYGVLNPRSAQASDSAWAKGMLVADDMALSDFTAELARYRGTPLACDPAVQGLRISGTYPLADTDRVLAVLPRLLPVRVDARRAGDASAGLLIRAR